jgi:hypothetical protein
LGQTGKFVIAPLSHAGLDRRRLVIWITTLSRIIGAEPSGHCRIGFPRVARSRPTNAPFHGNVEITLCTIRFGFWVNVQGDFRACGWSRPRPRNSSGRANRYGQRPCLPLQRGIAGGAASLLLSSRERVAQDMRGGRSLMACLTLFEIAMSPARRGPIATKGGHRTRGRRCQARGTQPIAAH